MGSRGRRRPNPYYMQIDVSVGVERILCFFGAFLEVLLDEELYKQTRIELGKNCSSECINIEEAASKALRQCGIAPEEVRRKNLLPTFHNSLRYLGILVPPEPANLSRADHQRRLCEWLMSDWNANLRAIPSRVSVEAAWLLARLRGARQADEKLLRNIGALLLLNTVLWYGGVRAKPPAILTALALIHDLQGCRLQCEEQLTRMLGVKRRNSVERKLKGFGELLHTAIEVIESSGDICEPLFYCTTGLLCGRMLVDMVKALARKAGCDWCNKIQEVCAI